MRTPPQQQLENPWDVWDIDPPQPDSNFIYPRPVSMAAESPTPARGFDRRTQTFNASSGPSSFSPNRIPFPEPQIYHRSESLRPTPPLRHRPSHSDAGHGVHPMYMHRGDSTISHASSYRDDISTESFEQESEEAFTCALTEQQLKSAEGLEEFQSGHLPEIDQEWHRLVPPEALEALGKQEVQRQSVIFESIKGERDYVADLQAVQDVFIGPLRAANPPIIDPRNVSAFIGEVFGNLSQILAHHRRIAAALFARQKDQHPVVLSIADLVLDTALKSEFRTAYETYIKHYPLAESHHRKELKKNAAYQAFIQSAAKDPRIRKRDLITFLSRPCTRLPRLNLLLEQSLKLTEKGHEHPDLETLPIIIGVLKDCIRSTQPGIEAAESKVKFWALCESLVFQKGEIMDMDLYEPGRTLIHSGPLVRKIREEWSGWTDLQVALLDNFMLLTREEARPNGQIKRYLMSRPLPLSFLRLGLFTGPPETRKESAKDGRLLDSFRYTHTQLYPFTVYHATSKFNRRYTLYASSEAVRKAWHDKLLDAVAISNARLEGNMFFAPRDLTSRTFGIGTSAKLTAGRPSYATVCSVKGKKWMLVGTSNGIYVGHYGDSKFTKVLNYSTSAMASVYTYSDKVFDMFVVLYEGSLLCYSLHAMVRAAEGQEDVRTLSRSAEQIDTGVMFFRLAVVQKRVLLIYGSKRTLHSPSLTVLEAVDLSLRKQSPKRATNTLNSFRPFGEPGYIAKDAYDVVPLMRNIAVATLDGMAILDPTNVAKSSAALVPDWETTHANPPMASLKTRISTARPLGIVRCDTKDELLMIYDAYGFYITKHGKPTRASGYIKWESKATSYTSHGRHILLFSFQFIEIRELNTGRLVQAIEGQDIRLLYSPLDFGQDGSIVVAMRQDTKGGQEGFSDNVVELSETAEVVSTPRQGMALWDEWDM